MYIWHINITIKLSDLYIKALPRLFFLAIFSILSAVVLIIGGDMTYAIRLLCKLDIKVVHCDASWWLGSSLRQYSRCGTVGTLPLMCTARPFLVPFSDICGLPKSFLVSVVHWADSPHSSWRFLASQNHLFMRYYHLQLAKWGFIVKSKMHPHLLRSY